MRRQRVGPGSVRRTVAAQSSRLSRANRAPPHTQALPAAKAQLIAAENEASSKFTNASSDVGAKGF